MPEVCLLTIKQVCERVALSRARIYERVKAGSFPAPTYLGEKMPRWRSDAIDAWIEEVSAAPKERNIADARRARIAHRHAAEAGEPAPAAA